MADTIQNDQTSLLAVQDLVWRNTIQVRMGHGAGTGFYVAANLVVTNAHCVLHPDHKPKATETGLGMSIFGLRLYHPHREGMEIRIEEGIINAELDLALLKVDHPFQASSFLTLADRLDPTVDRRVIVPDSGVYGRSISTNLTQDITTPPGFKTGALLMRKNGTFLNERLPADHQVMFRLNICRGFSGSPIVHISSGQVLSVVTVGACEMLGRIIPMPNSLHAGGPSPTKLADFVQRASKKLQGMPSGVG